MSAEDINQGAYPGQGPNMDVCMTDEVLPFQTDFLLTFSIKADDQRSGLVVNCLRVLCSLTPMDAEGRVLHCWW